MADWPEEARVAAIKAIDATGIPLTVPQAMRLATDILNGVAPVLAEAWGVKVKAPKPKTAAALAREAGRMVGCPVCGAAAGEMCRAVKHRDSRIKVDYTMSHVHAARKRAAAARSTGPEENEP